MLNDLRFAFRQLDKVPGFTVVALLTIALGIGLNTAMFSLVNSLMLRPLPFAQSDRLVRLQRVTPQNASGGFSPADYLDLRREEAAFGRFAGYTSATVAVAGSERSAQPQELLRVSANFFDVLGLQPVLGRTFRPEEEIGGNHRVILLSHGFWQTWYGGATNVVGQTLRIDAEPHEIIGVLPPAATERRPFDRFSVFRPLGLSESDRATHSAFWLSVVGRRDPGVSAAAGEALVAGFASQQARDFPAENQGATWRVESLLASTVSDAGRGVLLMLFGLSGCVLLIACSNLANLLLTRTLARYREFAVRAALGASQAQLLKPLVFESLVLAVTGGLGALFVAQATTRWFAAQIAASGEIPMDLSFDGRVLAATLGTALLTFLFFGIAPALQLRRVTPGDALKSGARGATATRGQQRFRQALIVSQVAMAMILLAGAVYLVRGADRHLRQSFGWNAQNVIQAGVTLPATRYATLDRVRAFQRTAIEQLARIPGVESASASQALPYLWLPTARSYVIAGREPVKKGQEPTARPNAVTPDFFVTTGVRPLQGRSFTAADHETAPRVAMVSESFARAHFPNGDALGARIARTGNGATGWMEIVGIVADVRSMDPGASTAAFQLYQPLAQEPRNSLTLAVRVTPGVAMAGLIDPIRKTLANFDADLPVSELMPVNDVLERGLSAFYLVNQLLRAFAVLGLFLAALGIYGVTARTVEQRTSEIGLRMALGAQVSDILRLVLGTGLRVMLIGAAIGAVGSVALSRLLQTTMPGLQPGGVAVIATAGLALMLVAGTACYLPARRAARVDPVVALRNE